VRTLVGRDNYSQKLGRMMKSKRIIKGNTDRATYWRKHVSNWSKSGLTQAEYCRGQKLSTSTFYGWKGQLLGRTKNLKKSSGKKRYANHASDSIQSMEAYGDYQVGVSCASPPYEIVLSGGRAIRVDPPDFDPDVLKRLIAIVESCNDASDLTASGLEVRRPGTRDSQVVIQEDPTMQAGAATNAPTATVLDVKKARVGEVAAGQLEFITTGRRRTKRTRYSRRFSNSSWLLEGIQEDKSVAVVALCFLLSLAFAVVTTLGYFVSTAGINEGIDDPFVLKYDPASTANPQPQFGTSKNEWANGITTDGFGGIYVSGITDDIMGEANAGDSDAFVTNFDSRGNHLWTYQMGTTAWGAGDGLGNIFTTGITEDFITEPPEGWGFADPFVAKLIPEPATLLFLGLGAVMVRRKR